MVSNRNLFSSGLFSGDMLVSGRVAVQSRFKGLWLEKQVAMIINPLPGPTPKKVHVSHVAGNSGTFYLKQMGVSKNRENHQNGWFIMVPNPIKMDDLGGPPLFWETPKYTNHMIEHKTCSYFKILFHGTCLVVPENREP